MSDANDRSAWVKATPQGANVTDLLGKTFKKIDRGNDYIYFFTDDDQEMFCMEHHQDCCESVEVEDIVGELDWLVGSPILQAVESTNCENPKDAVWHDSCTWTFYHLATAKGYVTIRWYGTSNGYYSERVDMTRYVRKSL